MNGKEIIKQIDSYIKGKLTTRETDLLWVKFLENPQYFEWFETELHLRYLLKRSNGQLLKNKSKSTFYTYKHLFLAVAAVLVISFGYHFLSSQESSVTSNALQQINHSELVGADVLRSGNQQVDPIDISINEALAEALENNPAGAIEKFRQILQQSPNNQQRARVELNLGILLYNNADYINSSTHFQAVTEIPDLSKYFIEKAWWFLGNTYVNLHQLQEARQAVFNAYTLDGQYKKPALALLKKLDVQLGNVMADDHKISSN